MHSDPLPSSLSAWVQSLALYVSGVSPPSPISALSDHDGWEESWRATAVVPSQEHVLVGALLVVLTSAGMAVLSSVPEDTLRVLRADFGGRGCVLSHR